MSGLCPSHTEVYEYDAVGLTDLVTAECSANLCTARADINLRKEQKKKETREKRRGKRNGRQHTHFPSFKKKIRRCSR
jgi:hypothetical protein